MGKVSVRASLVFRDLTYPEVVQLKSLRRRKHWQK